MTIHPPPTVSAYAAPDAAPRAVPAVPRSLRPLHQIFLLAGTPCEIVLASGATLQCGEGPPEFRLRLRTDDAFRRGIEELEIARAYIEGDFDIELSMQAALDIREKLASRPPVALLAKLWVARVLRPLAAENREAIESHYSLGDDFYLTFIDGRWRFYSHGLFHSEDESIEEASEHKLERMYSSLNLRPGMRLLDIGAGWGGVEQYCGTRGVHVTGLTIAPDSHRYISRLIEEHDLPAEARLEDFLKHQPAAPYDAIVIYGVIEHLPNYRLFVQKVWECLRPGGRLYVDASASRQKYRVSGFSRTYVWPGTHTFLCLQDFMRELLYQGMDVLEVKNESRDYELTMLQWATRLDGAREQIVARWGEQTYRAFRLYLWGGTRSFHHDRIQAYSIVAQRNQRPGPRPGWIRRGLNGIKGIV